MLTVTIFLEILIWLAPLSRRVFGRPVEASNLR
jgi:hypothetical protein